MIRRQRLMHPAFLVTDGADSKPASLGYEHENVLGRLLSGNNGLAAEAVEDVVPALRRKLHTNGLHLQRLGHGYR